VSEFDSGIGQFGVFMFMIGTIAVLSTSAMTTLVFLHEHGDPDPVVRHALGVALMLTIAGATLYVTSFVNWQGLWSATREVIGR